MLPKLSSGKATSPRILKMQSTTETSMNMKRQRDDDDDDDEEQEVAIYGRKLPNGLIFSQILTRLPVKSLVRFKLVSKQWKSAISSPDFAKTHLQHTAADPNFSVDASSRCVVIQNSSSLRILNYASCDDFAFDSDKINVELDELECPNFDTGSPFLIGSANGLVALGVEDDGYWHNKFFICNPCTGDYFACNEFPFDYGNGEYGDLFFGFGHASSSDDYKILIMEIADEKPTFKGSIFVYSLRYDSWERYPGFSKLELKILWPEGVLVHETLHYAVSWRCGWKRKRKKKKTKCIGAFNLDSEKFEFDMVPLPEAKFGHKNAYYHGDSSFQLSAMDGCLCAWAKYRNGAVQMWMLKQYGDWDSWTKMFSLNMFLQWRMRPQNVFGYSPTGKILVRTDSEGFVLVNIDKSGSKYVSLVKQDTDMEAVSFVGSLLLPFTIAGSLRKE